MNGKERFLLSMPFLAAASLLPMLFSCGSDYKDFGQDGDWDGISSESEELVEMDTEATGEGEDVEEDIFELSEVDPDIREDNEIGEDDFEDEIEFEERDYDLNPPHDCMEFEPGVLEFGIVEVGQSKFLTMTLENICSEYLYLCGVDISPSSFRIPNTYGLDNTVVPPNTKYSFSVEFLPHSEMYYEAIMSICYTDTYYQNIHVPLSGHGANIRMETSPTRLSFIDVPIGEQDCKTITMINSGILPFRINRASIYSQSSENAIPFDISWRSIDMPLMLEQGQEAKLEICYEPRMATESDFAQLEIFYNDNKQSIPLRGYPVWAQCEFRLLEDDEFNISDSPNLDFGEVNLGEEKTFTLRVNSVGTSACVIDPPMWSYNCSDAFFVRPENIPPINPGTSLDIQVGFGPFSSDPQLHSGFMYLETNDSRWLYASIVLELSGMAVEPSIFCLPASSQHEPIDFGFQFNDLCSDRIPISCFNGGEGILKIFGYEIVGAENEFIVGDWSTPPLGADPWLLRSVRQYSHDALYFGVEFCPSGLGHAFPSLIKIISNDLDNPQHIIWFDVANVECPEECPYNPTINGCYCCMTPYEDRHPWETCDGLDNDCDGRIDEFFDIGQPCEGMGECGTGVIECREEMRTRCSTEQDGLDDQSAPETCDGKDNDCDGYTDNGEFHIYGQPEALCYNCVGTACMDDDSRLGSWTCLIDSSHYIEGSVDDPENYIACESF